MQTIEQFCEKHRIRMQTESVGENPLMEPDPNWQANHYKIRLRRGNRKFTTYFSMGIGIMREPTVVDVVSCLKTDAFSVSEDYAPTFEAWCDEFGYDPDSRRAERIYSACKDHAARLERFLGSDLLAELFETEED